MKKLAAGIDIGGTNTAFGLVDRDGNMYAEAVIPTTDFPDFDDYVNELYITVEKMLKTAGPDAELAGVGIGAPAANYYNGTIEHAANLVWKGILPLAERVKRFYPNLPVIVANDANAAAIGEMVYGGARGMKDFIFVTLGTGVGSGFVAGRRLIYGHDSYAGELGHTIVKQSGRQCGCGRKGCLDTYASATGIKRTVYKLMADEIHPSAFRDVPYSKMTAEMVTRAALDGDPLAAQAFEYTGEMLGLALANAVAITSPEAIFLFGGLAKAGKYIFEPAKRHMEENLLVNYQNKVKLLPSALDDKNAAILGASALVWESLGEA